MKNYATHELNEMQDAISATLGAIHITLLSLPQIRDKQLSQIAEKQLQFMQQEYNQLVGLLNQQSSIKAQPYKAPQSFQPKYGLSSTSPQTPSQTVQELGDKEIAGILLGAMKSSATIKFHAAIECADSTWRMALQQCAVNCSEMSYELWQFMNQNGYYQLPTLQANTQQSIIQSYGNLVHQ